MLRMARQANTTDIVATPHASPSYRYDPELISDLIGKLK
jgi:tyrosine-protein phosphatase YwqE